MKKFSLIFSPAILLLACNNNNNNTSNKKVGEDIEPYRQVGVENVNGNIPDTTNSIDLSTNKVDTLKVNPDSQANK